MLTGLMIERGQKSKMGISRASSEEDCTCSVVDSDMFYYYRIIDNYYYQLIELGVSSLYVTHSHSEFPRKVSSATFVLL